MAETNTLNNQNQEINSQNNNQNNQQKKKKKTKTILMVVIMVLVTALALYYILKDDPAKTLQSLMSAKIGYVLLMLLFVVITFFIEGCVLTILSKLYYKKYRVYQGILNGMVGSFFSCITPMASGGQFAQVYTFSRQGIKSSNSASILVMLFIVSQTVIIIYGTLAMIFGYNSTIANMGNLNLFGWEVTPMIFSILGFIINVFTLLILLMLAYLRPLHRFVLVTGVNFFAKLHLVKDPVAKRSELAASIATFRIELTRLFKNFWVLIVTMVLEFIKFTFTNSIPFLAGLALDAQLSVPNYLSFDTYMRCVWSTSYQSMITGFIPIPGASGVSEGAFQLLFDPIYNPTGTSSTITSACNILNRAVTFYFSLFAGFIVFISYRGSPKKTAGVYDLQKTFVDLKIVSLASKNSDSLPILKEINNDSEVLKTSDNDESAFTKTSLKIKKSFRNVVSDKQTMEKDAMQYLSFKEVESSFNSVKKYLTTTPDDDINSNEYDETTNQTKSVLASVYKEMEDIESKIKENNKKEEEINLAVQRDLEVINRKEEKRKKKKERALLRKRNENKEDK